MWKIPDRRDWLWGNLGLVLMGRAMLSKYFIKYSVDGWGSTPSLLFGLWPNYGSFNGSYGDLLQKHLCQHTLQLPQLLYSVPLTPRQATVDPQLCRRLLDTHRQVWLSLLWAHYSCLLAFGFVCALQESFSPVQLNSVMRSRWPSKSNSLGVLRIGNTWTIFSG